LANADANRYVSGIAVHWYQNFLAPPSVLTTTHEKFPDRFILATEACEGIYLLLHSICTASTDIIILIMVNRTKNLNFLLWSKGTFPKETVVLGAWERLESYAKDIIEVSIHNSKVRCHHPDIPDQDPNQRSWSWLGSSFQMKMSEL
jgi:glucosylceramidase